MSIFTAVGMKEPQWATNFKNVINTDNLPNPLKKVQSKDAQATDNKVSDFFKKADIGISATIKKIFNEFKAFAIIAIVLFVIYLFKGRK